METVVFEEGDTNETLIRKLKEAKAPIEIVFTSSGGEVPSGELLELMTEKIAKCRIETRMKDNPRVKFKVGYEFL